MTTQARLLVGPRIAPRALLAAMMVLAAGSAHAQADPEPTAPPREALLGAIQRGVEVVQKAARNYPMHRECFACHHQTLPLAAMTAAASAGATIDRDLVPAIVQFTQDSFRDRIDDLKSGKGVGGRGLTVGYGLWTLRLAGAPPDDLTEAMTDYLLQIQEPDGHWKLHGVRPPAEESLALCTALAASGLENFAAASQREAARVAIDKARAWLTAMKPEFHEDRVARLWVQSLLAGSVRDDLLAARRELLGTQRDDGGWSQTAELDSDAYATGTALSALLASRAVADWGEADRSAAQRAAGWLVRRQLEDGSWHVVTRATPVQVFFDNGDPHGKDQFISIAATGWAVAALATLAADAPPDLLLADFEGEHYGDWIATGEAFGAGPAPGTLPGQMPVSGFEGNGLVNTFRGGDGATGTLTSPEFTIERPHINFLIGGGKHLETCLNLLIDGNVVRSASGPNDRPGGSERLDWRTWDVKDLRGRRAALQIIDRHTGGWGHINVDQITQSARRRQAEPQRRELEIDQPYLWLPFKTGAPPRRMRFLIDGRTVREFEIELAEEAPDFQAFADVSAFRGATLVMEVEAPAQSRGLAAIRLADQPAGPDLYHEARRPQFHFTSRRGWLNDPNGLVYFQGAYHLFYQHNPYGWNWGNMHWGHAVSPDLVHWEERPLALYPRAFGDWAFSGSAVIDARNSAGFQRDGAPALVAAYTSTGRGECLAYSTDGGSTWTEYDGNPVVRHAGRDPRLFWHEPTGRWIMAVYDEHDGKQWIAFYSSSDLKEWELTSRIDGFFECPDLFELPVSGSRPGDSRWVLSAADGKYVLGRFDGRTFTPDAPGKQQLWHGHFYAAQTFSDAPDGRRIQIGWARGIEFPGMPFNQQMTVACELSLRQTAEGVRMFAEPVAELAALYDQQAKLETVVTPDGLCPLITGELFDVEVEFSAAQDDTQAFSIGLRGVPVIYDFRKQTISCGDTTAPLSPEDGRVRLRILLDRGSIEVFGNSGRVALCAPAAPVASRQEIELRGIEGSVDVRRFLGRTLKSAWAVLPRTGGEPPAGKEP